MTHLARTLCLALVGLLLAAPAAVAIEHPFILWDADDVAAIKKRIESDPAAKKQLEHMLSHPGWRDAPTYINLFKYAVLNDEEAGQRELNALLKFQGQRPQGVPPKGTKLEWHRGGPSAGDKHMRDEQTLNTLRYDVLYDKLTDKQRKGVEDAFHAYIEFHLSGHKPWHPDFAYDRTSWLPNMHWPRTIGTHLMAAALQDKELVEKMFNSTGGWKWYFDKYIADGRFYYEEFGKQYSNIGTMLQWCEALRRLGWDEYGYGYTGEGGATMKRFLASYLELTYPRTEIPGGRHQYPRVTMGDAKGLSINGYGQHAVVTGYLPNGKGGNRMFSTAHMNGPLPKMRIPMWMEMAARRWPDAGFDYFLAQMRGPDQEAYLPSLVLGHGLGPIDPKKVKPPKPHPSYVAEERGFAMLRADETPSYWEGPAPAVAQQFASYYVHYVHDCFTILGYQAFNRPIYLNGGGTGRGYAGGSAWRDNGRGHSTLIVDNLQPQPVHRGYRSGRDAEKTRHHFSEPAKFVAVRAKGVYPGVDMERALVLTDAYLFDLGWLTSDRERSYDWQVLSPFTRQVGDGWTPTDELDGGALYKGSRFEKKTAGGKADLEAVYKRDVGTKAWAATLLDQSPKTDPAETLLGKAWYGRGIGVTVRMLPAEETTLYAGLWPGVRPSETGAGESALIVRRKAPETVFVALHEPFEGGKAKLESFERIAQTQVAVAARVAGPGVDDRVLMAFGDGADTVQTLAGDGERFAFTGYGYVRVGKDKVTVVGDVEGLKVKVGGKPTLVVNGEKVDAKVSGGALEWTK